MAVQEQDPAVRQPARGERRLPREFCDSRRTVDFIYIDAGGGHRAAATALAEVIRRQERPWDLRLLNVQDLLYPIDFIRKSTGIPFQDVYNIMLRRGWTLGTAQLIPAMHAVIRLCHQAQVRVLERHWRLNRPDMVVSLVPHYNRAFRQALDRAWPGTPLVTVLNLPPGAVHSFMAAMQAYTSAPRESELPDLLRELSGMPETLVVLNHPFWLEEGVTEAGHSRVSWPGAVGRPGFLHRGQRHGARPIGDLAGHAVDARRSRRRGTVPGRREPASRDSPAKLRCGRGPDFFAAGSVPSCMRRRYDKLELMLRIVALTLLATALRAQDSPKPVEKAPAKVDQALRARANQFYQDFVKGEFSDAETLVAPESKNYFVAIKKEKYLSCEIKNADYSDKFRLAGVGAVCERNIMFEGFAGHPMKYPISSQWKLEHGKWYWYVDPSAQRVTPFGMMGLIAGMTGAATPAGPPVVLPSPADLTSPALALHKVSVDKPSLALKPGESAEVAFSNSALGTMSISLYGVTPQGFEVTPTHADLERNGKATVTVKALEGANPAVLNFQVMPTAEVIAIKVEIQ